MKNLNDTGTCSGLTIEICPAVKVPDVLDRDEARNTDTEEDAGSLVMPIAASLGIVGALGGMVFLRQRRGSKLTEDDLLRMDEGYFSNFNPLYVNQAIEKENPLYIAAEQRNREVHDDQDDDDMLIVARH